MGIFSIASQHIRFAVKLACAIVLALFVGFHFQLETPRWAVLTAAIVAAGPLCRGRGTLFWRDPLSRDAAYHRDVYRLYRGAHHYYSDDPHAAADADGVLYLGGFLHLDLVPGESGKLLRLGLAGYTALIIIITIQSEPLLAPQFAVERCSEIVIGIVSAIVADLLFSPRSIKQEVDRELDALIVAQYQLMQLCIKHGDSEEVDKAWSGLVRRTQALEGMRSNLNMESSRWARANRRLKALNTVS
jgi:p-hydroxybenzoic acid efflux pump subunit AaeB